MPKMTKMTNGTPPSDMIRRLVFKAHNFKHDNGAIMNSNTPTQNIPVRGATYNLRTIYQLDLQDSPCLMVMVEGRLYPVQDSHVTIDELLSVPGLADTEWAYRYTTEEWIPVFDSCSGQTAFFFDIQRLEAEDSYWITPKGFPREVSE